MMETKTGSKYMEQVRVLSQEQIEAGIFSMWLETEHIAGQAAPGQFVLLYCKDRSRMLPRPISICDADPCSGKLRLVYRTAGEGTREFSRLRSGDSLDVTGPMGNGFPMDRVSDQDTSLLAAGGIGIPPMLLLARKLPGRKCIVLGYRDRTFLTEELEKEGELYLATEDGSKGVKGNVMDCIARYQLKPDRVYACGPAPMLRALQSWAAAGQTECWLSLEERMACGIGACLACVCRTKETDPHSKVHNARVCVEGPVFAADQIVLQDAAR